MEKYGFVDKTGKEIVECKYDEIHSFVDEIAIVEKDEKYGFIDKTGKEVVECKYDKIYNFSDGMAKVRKDGKYGFVDKSGKEIIECKYDDVYSFSDGMAIVRKDGKYGFIDKSGKEIIECKYDFTLLFDGFAIVENSKEYYIINSKGEIIYDINEIISQSFVDDEKKHVIKSIVFNPDLYLSPSDDDHVDCNCGPEDVFYTEYLASSELTEGEKTHYASNLYHKDTLTSWVEGVEGNGIGQKLEININRNIWGEYGNYLYHLENIDNITIDNVIDKLKDYYNNERLVGFWVVNGFSKNEYLWEANSRVKKIKLTIDDTKEYIVDLEDTRAIQYIDLNYKMNNIAEPTKVVVEILEVYEGSKYEDTALSLFTPEFNSVDEALWNEI